MILRLRQVHFHLPYKIQYSFIANTHRIFSIIFKLVSRQLKYTFPKEEKLSSVFRFNKGTRYFDVISVLT